MLGLRPYFDIGQRSSKEQTWMFSATYIVDRSTVELIPFHRSARRPRSFRPSGRDEEHELHAVNQRFPGKVPRGGTM